MKKGVQNSYIFSAIVGTLILAETLYFFVIGAKFPPAQFISMGLLGITLLTPMPTPETRWQSPRIYVALLTIAFSILALFSIK